jgi:TrmH family RNA methyltransferase
VPDADGARLDRFRRARRDRELAVIEGFHALKHALRFEAQVLEAICTDPPALERLAADLAPDVGARLRALAHEIDEASFAQIAPRGSRTGVAAIARRPALQLETVLTDRRQAPIVLLDEPRDLGNVGACIRVAAAAQAAGVLVTGRHDPWHADAIRGAAGLHYALPVVWCERAPLPLGDRPLIALDPAGEPLDLESLPARAVLAFGSERRGLSAQVLQRAQRRVRIPMAEGVSSLNLATSVAAVLFAMRLCGSVGGPPAGTW